MSGAAWVAELREAVQAGPGAGSTLLVAVSGGGDSVALLRGLVALRDELALTLVVAHLDHGLRPESAADAAFVGALALTLGLPCLRERREVAERLAAGGNLEAIARQQRYQMLEEAARATQADTIVLAHTADDQAETVLMNLLRGAGLDGLKGMLPWAPSPVPDGTVPLFRPLLHLTRATLRAWLSAHGYEWREDPTNADTSRQRSYLRHELFPRLEARAPGLRRRLARTAQLLADDHACLSAETEAAWQRLARLTPEGIALPRAPFLTLPLALQRRLLRRAFTHLRPSGHELGFEHVTHALALAAQGESGAQATLPGALFLFVEQAILWIGGRPRAEGLTLATPTLLPPAGTLQHEGLTITVETVTRAALPADWQRLPPTVALLDAEAVTMPLRLRPPAPADRWQPLGMGGQQRSLHDWLKKHGVPPPLRDRVPLLVDGSGQILWVVGWQVGHVARVRPTSTALLRLTIHEA